MFGQLAKAEFDKVEKVKEINSVQVEKIKSINENQKYILSELSKINDRIIEYFKHHFLMVFLVYFSLMKRKGFSNPPNPS